MLPNEAGEVNNPLRDNIGSFLEIERRRRKLRHQQMAELFKTSPGQGLAYRTYIRTTRKRNNVTLRTVEHMAQALQVSIATLLVGGAEVEPWAHNLTEKSIRGRLAGIINSERERRNLLRYQMAELLGVSEITLNKLADADGNVSVDTIAAIGEALSRDPATFLFEDSDSQQPA
ncbi:XRE family transcriptional regulator [Mesorhizobium sp. M4B.F.Ca.ET.089.01.1.1]|uniref:helix-turn-helix domain-containing protein n=1 Tax=unclassified Mesorhizobium TaxID=325217 RepID=UPI000FE2EE4D|nr:MULTISPECIES: helix-turn-helix transcriptional regulator [unclassified Mesorhizobium]RWX59468.1 XRE family transcriptional regulator [Mesorhizobium sp. M4B.F.Ca.ET.089.01.1.1]TIX19946.1 MAG: helix-turn-helix transcriptional regulator [Mesorhizobium sp.]